MDNKKNIKIIIIALVSILIIAAIVLIVAIVFNKANDNEEEKIIKEISIEETNKMEAEERLAKITISNYIDAFNSLDSDKLLATIDLKAAAAWEKLTGTLEEKEKSFLEKYMATTNEEVETYTKNAKSEFSTQKSVYEKYLDNYKVTIEEMSNLEKVEGVEGLYKIKAKLITEYAYEGNPSRDESSAYFYLYNDKIVTLENENGTGVNEDNVVNNFEN